MLIQDYHFICELTELKCKLVKHILSREGSLNILRKIDTAFNFLSFRITDQDTELRQILVNQVLAHGFVDIRLEGTRESINTFLDTIFKYVIENSTPVEVYTWWSGFADNYLREFRHLQMASWVREDYLELVIDLGSFILITYALLEDKFDGFGKDKCTVVSALWNHCCDLSHVSETVV